jgi:ribosomal protein S18 acetylase RimI-like enzyme
VQIRPATLDDVGTIARNHVASWQAGYRGILSDELLDNLQVSARVDRWTKVVTEDAPGDSLLVVEDDGELRGHVYGAPATRPYHEGGEIISLYCPPEAWGHGYGRALLVAGREALVDLGYDQLGIWVLDGNDRAQRLYHRDGWVFDGTREPMEIDGIVQDVDELHMTWQG